MFERHTVSTIDKSRTVQGVLHIIFHFIFE